MMPYAARCSMWLAIYLFFVLGPLFVLMAGTLPPGRSFWTEFAVAIGYAGLAMMGLQFALTARFRYITEPWGEDVIYHFHRQLSLVAVGLVLLHPLILIATRPDLRVMPDLTDPAWGAVFAVLSIGALIVLVVTALWRTQLKISYELWHHSHIVLALVAIVGGILHMVGWGFYLTDPWKRALWIGLTVFWVALLFYVRIAKPLFMLRRPYRIAEVRPERGNSVTLAMQPDKHAGLTFSPGQFGWLTVWGGPFRITGHPFSFSSSAEAGDGSVEFTIRNLGDFTRTVGDIPVGKRVYIDGPYGAFTIDRNPADMHVLIAGGVGITPMMSMLRTLADRGDRRPVLLVYGSKDWDSITFREEIETLKTRIDLEVVHVLKDPPADWEGETGFIDAAMFRRYLKPPFSNHEYFICGPGPMMDVIERTLGELGVPISKYHSERYSFV